MNLENVSQKQLNELERMISELLAAMRKAKLHTEPIAKDLQQLEAQLGEMRRQRFDSTNSEYHSY
jgi:septal ring factor EnvC (AmiA/AmiB activator)